MKDEDKETLTKSFADSFGKEVVNSFFRTAMNSDVDPKAVLAALGVKCLVIGGRYAYAKYKKHASDKNLQEFWEDEIKGYERKIKEYLKESSDDYLNKMVCKYNRCYNYNYGRDDVSIEDLGIAGYKRVFDNISGYEQRIPELSGVSARVTVADSGGFNKTHYLKNNLTEDQKKDFDYRFDMYKAVWEHGEFSDQSHCGDFLASDHLDNTLQLSLFFIIPGLIYGAGAGIARGVKKGIWMGQ